MSATLAVGASAVVAAATLSGCSGGSGGDSRSARFTERSVASSSDEGPRTTTAKGTFDWGEREGDGARQWLGGGVEVIQRGDDCFQRFEGEPWKKIPPEESTSGVCALDLFGDPYGEFDLFRTVSEDLREVGREELRGIPTTHWRGTLKAGEAEGTVDMWIDADDVVRKRIQQDTGLRTVREYFDFGVDVDVEPPEEYEEGETR
jgi:hypothetical protein